MKEPGKIYNIKLIKSGNRLEVYKYQAYISTGEKSNNQEGRKGKNHLSQEQKEQNKTRARKETLVNARNNINRLISCNKDLCTFLTITYRDNFQDLRKSKEHLKLFFKKLQKDYTGLKYIYVLEYQDRGAIHYHILTNIKLNIVTARSKERKPQEQKDLENYYRVNYWSNRGFTDIRRLDQEGITNIAKYVSSYLVQDLMELDLQGNRAYGYSRNLNKPVITTGESKNSIEELISLEGYQLKYASNYKRTYQDKQGQYRESQVNYFDFNKLKES